MLACTICSASCHVSSITINRTAPLPACVCVCPWRSPNEAPRCGVAAGHLLHRVKPLSPVSPRSLQPDPDPGAQGGVEYTRQLLLSCLLNVCQKLSPDEGPMAPGTSTDDRDLSQIYIYIYIYSLFTNFVKY